MLDWDTPRRLSPGAELVGSTVQVRNRTQMNLVLINPARQSECMHSHVLARTRTCQAMRTCVGKSE